MRGGFLPPALICAALGFGLSFATPRQRIIGTVVLCSAATIAAFIRLPTDWVEIIFAGCWATVLLTAACVHLPKGVGSRLAIGLSVNAGLWTGAVISVAGQRTDLLMALPLVLLCLPGGWLVATKRGIAVKVAGSWLVAVAILCAFLAFIPTPGYAPDHMG